MKVTIGKETAIARLMQHMGQMLALRLNDAFPGQSIGFNLMVFEKKPGGFTTYVSNARADDMARLLRKQADDLEEQGRPPKPSKDQPS